MVTASRLQEFATGRQGTGEISSSLTANSAAWNSKVPGKWSPNSVIQQYMLSPNNGNSSTDASRQTPSGQMPGPNGMSASTYVAKFPINYETRVGF